MKVVQIMERGRESKVQRWEKKTEKLSEAGEKVQETRKS